MALELPNQIVQGTNIKSCGHLHKRHEPEKAISRKFELLFLQENTIHGMSNFQN